MRMTREGSENNPRFKMMEHGGIYQDIERMYGVKVAQMLRKYCELKNIDPYVVVNDTSIDKNGMCAWDKFDVWAKGKGVDFAAGFGNVDVDDLLGVGKPKKGKKKTKGHSARIYDRPTDSDIYGEGSGSRMNEWDIAGWLEEELKECEWVNDLKTSNDDYEDPWFEVDADGSTYRITVKKVFSPREVSAFDDAI